MLKMSENLSALRRLKKHGFDLKLTGGHSAELLGACCDLLDERGIQPNAYENCPKIQVALVERPGFLDRLLAICADGISHYQMEQWLKEEPNTGCRLEDYELGDVIQALKAGFSKMTATQEYLQHYLSRHLNEDRLENVRESLRAYHHHELPLIGSFSEAQRELLEHPFFAHALLGTDYPQMLAILADSPTLVGFLDELTAGGVYHCFECDDLKRMQQLDTSHIDSIWEIHRELGEDPDMTKQFILVWLENGAHGDELRPLIAKLRRMPAEERIPVFESRLSYMNLLYGGALGGVPFSEICSFALPLLSYALAKRQNAFLKLVAQNYELFATLTQNHMLFDEQFYTRIHLNSITLKNLKECPLRARGHGGLEHLDLRPYTYDELATLYKAPDVYSRLYQRLKCPRVDERMIILHQLTKRRALQEDMTDEQLDSLAVRLSEKPLMQWMEHDFSRIAVLKPTQGAQLLASWSTVQRFVPDMTDAVEADFALEHMERLSVYSNWAEVLRNIVILDTDWTALREALDLDDAFVNANREHIIPFLLRGGSSIACQYAKGQRDLEGFYRIVRAQLMGQYDAVKYHRDDLSRELDQKISDMQKRLWMENETLIEDGFEIMEKDDFFSTMLVGVIPMETCLNYRNGMYRECLLSCFDSNKKFLYAYLNGKPVARAMLRLTKGRFNEQSTRHLEFADLRTESASDSTTSQADDLVLFLERCYTSGLDQRECNQVYKLFMALTAKKAVALGVRPVFSYQYAKASTGMKVAAMPYYMYISRSKGGMQYLDSVGGSRSVSNEGTYHRGTFLLPAEDKGRSDD